jgi:hypothetical protein
MSWFVFATYLTRTSDDESAFIMIFLCYSGRILGLCAIVLVPCSFLLQAECLSLWYEEIFYVGLQQYDHSNSRAILMVAL